MFRRILVPMDDTALSERALDTALTLAGRNGARVWPLFVRAENLSPDASHMDDLDVEAVEGALVASVRARIRDDHGVHPDHIHPELRTGTPESCILDAARDHRIDLIVMGTHGRHGLVDWLAGSTTERVLRQAHCAMLVLRDPPDA